MNFLNVFNILKHISAYSEDKLSFYGHVFLEHTAALHGPVINSKAAEYSDT